MITLPTSVNYGVRILWALERHRRRNRRRIQPIPLAVIARELHLPQQYLAQIARKLTRAGMLESFEGIRGGYRLSGSLHRITLGDVVAALEPPRPLVRCLSRDDRRCPCAGSCEQTTWWRNVERQLAAVIGATPLTASL